MSRLEERIKGELRELLPPTICFFVAFRTITMSRAPMFREYGVKCSPPPPAQPSELCWSRRWWIADQLPMVNRFPDKPLIYRIEPATLIGGHGEGGVPRRLPPVSRYLVRRSRYVGTIQASAILHRLGSGG